MPVLDGVPCRSYRIGEHSAAIGRLILGRLVVAGLAAAFLSVALPLVIVLIVQGGTPSAGGVPPVARWAGSQVAFGIYLLVIDYFLIRGRLATAVSLLTWAGRRGLAALHAATGLRRATDRMAADAWLAAHPHATGESAELRGWRAHLQLLVGDVAAAEETIGSLPRATPEDALRADVQHAQLSLVQGLPFDADDLRAQVADLPDQERRADLAADVAAVIAQARWTCGGDHLGAVAWAVPFVSGRDRGTLLRGYWLPSAGLIAVTSLVLAVVFPAG
jgi:hypothetical protein